jgi:hypothetical protein
MKKRAWKYIVCFAFPLALAAGCAHDHSSIANSGTDYTTTFAPTSDTSAQRVYPADNSPIGQYAPPPGAPADDWTLAEQVRALLTSDKKLAREPMAATVNKGVVTLNGYVPNERSRERIEQAIAALPGVTHVDDQLVVQNILSTIKGKSKEY